MREQCDWPASTTPAAREQRRERVEQARRRIVYRPEPYEVEAESAPKPGKLRRLWLAGPFLLLAAAVVFGALVTGRYFRNLDHDFTYQLPGTPSFLTEQLALAKAQETLSQVVNDADNWRPLHVQRRKTSTAPDGTQDWYFVRFTPADPNAGMILFASGRHPNEELAVQVELRGAYLSCLVSRAR